MAESLTYVVAKHIPDLLRHEPRNIGVFVFGAGGSAGRLIGEDATGRLDLRYVPQGLFNDSDVYAEWHHHWRNLLAACSDPAQCRRDFIESAHGTFAVWSGGELFPESEATTPQALCDDLYARLVRALHPAMMAEGGIVEESGARSLELAAEIEGVFRVNNILATTPGQREALAPHPVQKDVRVEGTLPAPHLPKFVQENGRRIVMEQVDFTRSPRNGREHSCYAAYMLGDIRKAGALSGREVEAIAVVNRIHPTGIGWGRADAKKLESQKYGLGALENSSVRLVWWDDLAQRLEFIRERIETAQSP